MPQNKEQYFDNFSLLIKDLKENTEIEIAEIDKFYTDIANFDELNLQDIITYMLYCFEVIELTQKWKLKKLINYEFLLNNFENIYNEIFCTQNSIFNSKVFATSSLGNIIEKTITYDIESEISNVLDQYLKCIDKERIYLQNNNLVLLRGNLYCQVYNILKDNSDINSICNDYFLKIQEIFDYEKYIETANTFFENILDKINILYTEFYNFLAFQTYNNYIIKNSELKKIFTILSTKYVKEFFDKNIFIHLIKSLINSINKGNLNIELEIVFDKKDDTSNTILLDYNEIDCNFYNNLPVIQNVYCRANKIKYSILDSSDYYLKLLKIKDELISKKQSDNNSIINYYNMVDYFSMLEFNQYLELKDRVDFNYYFTKLIKNKNNFEIKDKEFTNNEIFMKLYSKEEIKELLKQYPLLSLEYDTNGSYKTIADLLKEKQSLLSNHKSDLKNYEKLLNYRDCDLYSLLNDYYSLFLIDSIDNDLIKEKEYLLKNILPNLLKLKLMYCGKITKEKLTEIYNEYINPCINKISQNRVQNNKFDNTKDFLNYEKSNSDNYAGICKLQEILEEK